MKGGRESRECESENPAPDEDCLSGREREGVQAGEKDQGDWLGEDFGLAAKDNLYRCLDRLLEHREELFKYLRGLRCG